MVNSSSEIGFWSYHPLTHVTNQEKNVEDKSYPIEIEKVKGSHYLNVKENEKTTGRVHVFIANGFFRKIKYFFLKHLGNNWTEITLDKSTYAAQPGYKKSIKLLIDNKDFLSNRSASQKIESIFGSALSQKIPELKQVNRPGTNVDRLEDDLDFVNEDLGTDENEEIERQDLIPKNTSQDLSLLKIIGEINSLILPESVKKLFTQRIEFIQKLSDRENISADELTDIAEITTEINDFINLYKKYEQTFLSYGKEDYRNPDKISKNFMVNISEIYSKLDDFVFHIDRLNSDLDNEGSNEELYVIKEELFLHIYKGIIFNYKKFEENLEDFYKKSFRITYDLSFEVKKSDYIKHFNYDELIQQMNRVVNNAKKQAYPYG